MLANMVAHLADRPLKNKGASPSRPASNGSDSYGSGPAFDDDIPFAPLNARSAWAI
jgi:hypothetical protein